MSTPGDLLGLGSANGTFAGIRTFGRVLLVLIVVVGRRGDVYERLTRRLR